MQILGSTIAVATFALAFALAEPYPGAHIPRIFLGAASAFALILATRNESSLKTWWFFGVTTLACYLVPFYWFWAGAWRNGWWYPPHPQILRHFMLIDGEAGYDAEVSDLFLCLWAMLALVVALRHLTIAWSGSWSIKCSRP